MSTVAYKRHRAALWWSSLTYEQKFFRVIAWLKSQGRDTTELHPHSLTTDQVTQIWMQNTL